MFSNYTSSTTLLITTTATTTDYSISDVRCQGFFRWQTIRRKKVYLNVLVCEWHKTCKYYNIVILMSWLWGRRSDGRRGRTFASGGDSSSALLEPINCKNYAMLFFRLSIQIRVQTIYLVFCFECLHFYCRM